MRKISYNKKGLVLIFLLSFVLTASTSNARYLDQHNTPIEFYESDYIYFISTDISSSQNNHVIVESPFRRFQVTFFISLPFIFVFNFLALQAMEEVRSDRTVSLWRDHKTLLLSSTFATSFLISFREAMITWKMNRTKRYGHFRERTIHLCLSKNY